VKKLLDHVPLGRELRILLHLAFYELVGKMRHTLIDFHHDEQILRSLAMAVVVSQRDDRGKP